jgi:tRNA(Arg) A34 adenosine deaminase TadA
MREALRLAREAAARREVPVGTVVVRSGRGNRIG